MYQRAPRFRLARSIRLFAAVLALFTPHASAQWGGFVDETSTRLSADPVVGENDVAEKDYAWGDVDNDGDIDLVVVRKEPATSAGKRTNVLFLNENGVLVDRTVEFATDSDVEGDLGFLTPTNDRDVVLVDVNGDGWLDIVTAVTLSDGDPKHVGHPRVYMNRKEAIGVWQGFRFEDIRIPTMLSHSGQPGFNPRFCAVAAGDLTGDGRPELYFTDYDSGGVGGVVQPGGADFNDKLLLNQGNGKFVDATIERITGEVDDFSAPFEISAFGAAGVIVDMNGDGYLDVVKQTALSFPQYVGVTYNDPLNEGFFDDHDVPYSRAPYFVNAGDLNRDGLPDLVVTDDGFDQYLINQGNDELGRARFVPLSFAHDAASDEGFGSNSVIVDLNNDGWNDVLIADVDVDIPGCTRRMKIYRNLGGPIGGNVTLQEQTQGQGCDSAAGNPATCLVADIPANKLEGVHDVAVFDLDGDGWQDMVVGRCSGTEIYMNRPPAGLAFSYPQGLPLFVEPDTVVDFQFRVNEFGGAAHEPGSARMFVSVAGALFAEASVTDLGGGLYETSLPSGALCTETLEFYLGADATDGGGTFFDPPLAPIATFRAIAAAGRITAFVQDFESDVSVWTVVNHQSLAGGGWEVAEPVGTLSGGGAQPAPDDDAEAAAENVRAFITENGIPGGAAADADVDGGPTDLFSPVFSLEGTDGFITYARWFFSDGDDRMEVSITNDGMSWTPLEELGGSLGGWKTVTYRVGEFVAPTATMQVRFRVSDSPNDSITEAGIDLFRVELFVCDSCMVDQDCNDGVFCNGNELCADGFCLSGEPACPGQVCTEATQSCTGCFIDSDCADNSFCNGHETCVDNACVAGTDPCPGTFCDELLEECVLCFPGVGCEDDGIFCNGEEICSLGECVHGPVPCQGRPCDESMDRCVGFAELQPRAGDPLPGLNSAERARFDAGRVAFSRTFDAPAGLGPVFNQNSCGSCHNRPPGGSGSILVTRFGHNDDKGGGFDPLTHLGGSLRQSESLNAMCAEEIPPEANVVARRLTSSTLGSGLVEAVADSELEGLELAPPGTVTGRVHRVAPLENPGRMRAGRFGWKSQVATVLSFSADAALNEMGITNRLLPDENAPNGDTGLLAQCDTVPDPEDGPDGEGFDFIDRVTDFQRFLAAPPQTPRSGMSGEVMFTVIGCAACHVAAFTTPDDASLETALRDRTLKPYSDFLLHDMGETADFIEQDGAEAREIRTTPLWGLRFRDPLWHDGRFSGGTFASRVTDAITAHDALGSEARSSALSFFSFPQSTRDLVLAFLESLGRVEFDHDGDEDVDADDYAVFDACFTGPGDFYSADDACAVSDVDQDGDVDDADFTLFQLAAEGFAGAVPDDHSVPGPPLSAQRELDGRVTLDWSASCLLGDLDYAIYEGTVGDFSSHVPLVCSTAGSTIRTVTPSSGDTFYLVVPTNGFREGSYGFDGAGLSRPASTASCLPQSVGACTP